MIESLRKTLTALHPTPLSVEEAEAIVAIAQLVVDIDGREGPDEIKLFFDIGKLLFTLAGQPNASVPTFASDEADEERMFELATQLKGEATRELAFAVGYALAAVDDDIASAEGTFIDRMRGILSVPKPRAEEIAKQLKA